MDNAIKINTPIGAINTFGALVYLDTGNTAILDFVGSPFQQKDAYLIDKYDLNEEQYYNGKAGADTYVTLAGLAVSLYSSVSARAGATAAQTAGTTAGQSGSTTTRVGRWMSEAEYTKMVETGKVQLSPNGNTTYVANPANPNAFKAAPKGSVYVEFDVPINSIYPAGQSNWGQIAGPGSLWDRFNQGKGLPPINGMPDATNIQIMGGN